MYIKKFNCPFPKYSLNRRYIGTRLDKINGHIKQLSETEDYGLKCKWKKFLVVNGHYVRNPKNRKRVLWTVM